MLPELTKLIERFQAEMAHVDEVVHVLLKGHLLIEEALNRILAQHVFHREHLSEARLSFNQRMFLARSLCLRKNNNGEWELIAAINSLRNELAHKLNSSERENKLNKVKSLYFREAAGLEGIEDIRNQPDSTILCFACAHCSGFLAEFEADAKAFRQIVHTIDRQMNPDLPAFEL